jgi:endogenous inhibitor of DNA gyrase (YacG/DUF329 family)
MQLHCPLCRKLTTWEENPWKPFCSERCKLIDLGKWSSEQYRVPAEAKPAQEKEVVHEKKEGST